MIDHLFILFVDFLSQISPEIPSLLLLCFCYSTILLASRMGLEALFVYNAVGIIVGNIQVLKLTEFAFYSNPVTVGNIVFASTFIASTIIIHNYGMEAAKKSIKLSFFAQTFFVIIMALSTGHKIANVDGQLNVEMAFRTLFVPQTRFIVASVISFAIGQYLNAIVFDKLRQKFQHKYVWFMQNSSNTLAAVIDNLIFSSLTWIVLSPTPISFKEMVLIYVIPGIFFRTLVSFTGTPIIYKSFNIINKKHKTI